MAAASSAPASENDRVMVDERWQCLTLLASARCRKRARPPGPGGRRAPVPTTGDTSLERPAGRPCHERAADVSPP